MNPKDQVKQNLNILDVVGTYIRLEKSGRQYKARCPFHNEKSGSFFVSPERGSYHCFGCGAHGDIFSFVEKVESVPFYEALKILADRAGVRLTPFNQEGKEKESRLISLLQSATRHFQNNLKDSPTAKKYLSDRGVSEEIKNKFEIGFALGGDSGWRDLFIALSKDGFSPEEMIRAGVVIKKENEDKWFDRFRGRIMFPIKNSGGSVIGYSARILPEFDDGKSGKYINSPETEVYHKSKALFGYDLGRKKIAEKREVIIVEGQMDLVMSHEAGVENIVATSGTAFGDEQIKIIKRFADKVSLSFDGDAAGEKAMKSASIMCLFGGLDVYVIPKYDKDTKDVADLVLKFGKESWINQIEKKKNIIEYILENILEKVERKEMEERDLGKAIREEIFPILRAIQSDLDRAYYIKLIASKIHMSEQDILHDLRNFLSLASPDINFKNDSSTDNDKNILEKSKIENLKKDLILKEILAILKWKKIDQDHFVEFNLGKEYEIKNIFLESIEDLPDEIVEQEIMRLENIFENNRDYKDKEEKFIKHLLHDLARNYKIEILGDKIKDINKNQDKKEEDLTLISNMQKEIQKLKNHKAEI